MTYRPTAIDLFSGCGGLSYGFERAGFHIKFGIDHDQHALATFEKNHQDSQAIFTDISKLNKRDIRSMAGSKGIDLLIGGPPCQGVSLSGHRLRKDPRNELFLSYLRLLSDLRPKAFVMENVPGLLGLFDGELKDVLLREFNHFGYTVSYQILNAAQYGVPQARKRVFFVGLANGQIFDFPKLLNRKPVTSFEALSDLPEFTLPSGSAYPMPPQSDYQKLIRKGSAGVYNHEITNHWDKTIEIISMVPDGGNYKNLPAELWNTRRVNIAWTRLNSQKPSFTVDTGHRHHFHYVYNRIPTVRENARLQSFPDSFVFVGTKTSQHRQVGNAVPPLLAKLIAKSLLEYI